MLLLYRDCFLRHDAKLCKRVALGLLRVLAEQIGVCLPYVLQKRPWLCYHCSNQTEGIASTTQTSCHKYWYCYLSVEGSLWRAAESIQEEKYMLSELNPLRYQQPVLLLRLHIMGGVLRLFIRHSGDYMRCYSGRYQMDWNQNQNLSALQLTEGVWRCWFCLDENQEL